MPLNDFGCGDIPLTSEQYAALVTEKGKEVVQARTAQHTHAHAHSCTLMHGTQ